MTRGLVARLRRREESGFTLVFVALTVVMLFTFVAIVVDLGNARQVARQEQNSADAGSLAGAQDLPVAAGWGCGSIPTAVTKAAAYAASTITSQIASSPTCLVANTAVYTAGAATITVTSPYSGDTNKINVQVCQTVNYAFAQIIGLTSQTPCRHAASNHTASVGRCGLCVLGAAGTTVVDTAGGNFTVKNADVVVNSATVPGAKRTGGGTFTVQNGTIGGPGTPFSGVFSPTPIDEPATPDPLASLPMCAGVAPCPTGSGPGPDANLDNQTTSNPSTPGSFTGGFLNPGVYNDVDVSNTGGLNPGIYVITGTFHAANSHAVTMAGVMLYFACTNYPNPCAAGALGGYMNWTGGGAITLSPPTTGTYAGMSIFFDRNNTRGLTPSITAGGGTAISGTVYMANSGLTMTGGGGIDVVNSSVVVDAFTYTGGGAVTIDPSGGLNAGGGNNTALLE